MSPARSGAGGSEFADAQRAQIDTVLNLLYVLLLFSVIIAVLGMINTLALSVRERTREIRLLHAIGPRRRQWSESITVEALATSEQERDGDTRSQASQGPVRAARNGEG